MTNEPNPSDVLEHAGLWGKWEPWGIVDRVEGDTVFCIGRMPVYWCFGLDGCLGLSSAFRVAARVTMEDPEFN